MARFRVTIFYREPLYARNRGIPERRYRGSFEVSAITATQAIERAKQLFRQAAAEATVSWPREIVDARVIPL